jgi:hypothetical protein
MRVEASMNATGGRKTVEGGVEKATILIRLQAMTHIPRQTITKELVEVGIARKAHTLLHPKNL